MAERVYYYAEDLGRETTATTNFSVAKASVTFTPNASKDHVIFWRCLLDSSSASWAAQARLRNTTASVTYGTSILSQPTTTIRQSAGGMAIYTSSASPASTTIRIEYASINASGTTGISETSIFILELGANDKFVESTGDTTSTSGTAYSSTKATLSFTPGSAGDYLLIAHGVKTQNDSGTDIRLRLYDTATQYIIPSLIFNGLVDCTPYLQMVRATNISAAQTWTIDFYRLGGPGNCVLREARIVALRMSDFDSYYWGEDRTIRNSITTTYADSASVTNTPSAVEHLVLACGITDMSSTGMTTYAGNKINVAGSNVGTIFSTVLGYTGFNCVWWEVRKRTEAASSTTWKTQYNRVSGSETTVSDENVIAAMQLQSSFLSVSATGENAAFSTGIAPVVSPAGI